MSIDPKGAAMKTRITKLFGIEYPIILSGMSWISVPRLVAAVCNAGGLGILATGVMTAEETREAVREIRKLTRKPFAANVTLYFPGAERNAQVLIEEKVPVVNYALGKGDKLTEAVHAYGGKVVATVTTHKHALAAERAGADALIVTGHEAAGHGGAITSLVLVPSIADAVKIPVIAAGGFADGRGLAAALSLGAEGISMGTRFMNTKESPVHDRMKKLSIEKQVYDTIYTPKVDGLPARFMKSDIALKMAKRPLNLISAAINSREIAKSLGFPWFKLALAILLSGYGKARQMATMANGFKAFKVGTIEGDNEKGVLPLGQVTGLINDTPTVKQVIERIVSEAKAVKKQIGSMIG
ncbi:MAG TPA: nitronate monooxygenase [Spirochaetota bacterium]|nr:nitronate monooxygenase [Spirochaetota bacterium]HNU92644.1 nitronate monooxygenase [Spirochaetota bacterium]